MSLWQGIGCCHSLAAKTNNYSYMRHSPWECLLYTGTAMVKHVKCWKMRLTGTSGVPDHNAYGCKTCIDICSAATCPAGAT